MATPQLVDPRGRPLRSPSRSELARPHALPSLTGVRSVWNQASVASGLTPEGLAGILRRADEGDGQSYLTLAEEMERREAHYRSVLGTRKRAVTRLPVNVEAASDSPEDTRLADEVRKVIAAPGFRGMLAHALDGLGKGFAAIEMRWDTRRTPWLPRDRTDPSSGERIRGYQWIDPRWFVYDRLSGRDLRLRDDSAPIEGLPLPPYRYLIHEPELMSGLPLGAGLARVATVAYIAKSYTLKDWLAFAEVYGMPLRVGKWGPGASEEDIALLVSAVANLGSDAAAAIPDSMLIEIIEASKASSAEVFSGLAAWADNQLSKLVLGQTASAEGGAPGMGGQDAQTEVREDLRDADAAELSDTLNRDLVGAYLALNHGAVDLDEAPRILIAKADEDDIPMLTDALARLIPLGLRVDAGVIRDKLGLPAPTDAAEILGAAIVGRDSAAYPAEVGGESRAAEEGSGRAAAGIRPAAGRETVNGLCPPAGGRIPTSGDPRSTPRTGESPDRGPGQASGGKLHGPANPTTLQPNRALSTPKDAQDLIDAEAERDPGYQSAMERLLAPILSALDEGLTPEQILGRLPEWYGQMDDRALIGLLDAGVAAAGAIGRLEVMDGDRWPVIGGR